MAWWPVSASPRGPRPTPGVYATSMEGVSTHTKAVGYFRVTSAAAGPPPSTGCDVSGNQDGQATPSSGKVGETLTITARGFQPREAVSFWFTAPNGDVIGTARPIPGGVNPDGTVGPCRFDLTADLSVDVGPLGHDLPGRVQRPSGRDLLLRPAVTSGGRGRPRPPPRAGVALAPEPAEPTDSPTSAARP